MNQDIEVDNERKEYIPNFYSISPKDVWAMIWEKKLQCLWFGSRGVFGPITSKFFDKFHLERNKFREITQKFISDYIRE